VRAFDENVPREGFGFFPLFLLSTIRQEEKFAEGREKASRTSCKKRFFVEERAREKESDLSLFFIFLMRSALELLCRRRGQNTKKGREREVKKSNSSGHTNTHTPLKGGERERERKRVTYSQRSSRENVQLTLV